MLNRFVQAAAATAFLTGAASAADLPRRAAPPPFITPPVFTWTGFHIGTTSGYAFSDRQTVRTVGNAGGVGMTNTSLVLGQGRRPATARLDQDGFVSGGGIGYDYQFGVGSGIVVGVAADATYMDLVRRRAFAGPGFPGFPGLPGTAVPSEISGFKQSLDYLGTVRGRVGYAFDNLLIYGTGGFAFGGVEYRARFLQGGSGALQFAGRYDDIETGYVYGGGVEYAIPADSFLGRLNLLSFVGIQSSGFTIKAEYLRYDLGRRNVAVNSQPGFTPGTFTSRFETEGNLVRGGFTYRFGGL